MDIDGLWLFSGSICWKHLEDSVIFPCHFILRHIRYGRVSVERPAVRSETQRFAVSGYFPSCTDLSICPHLKFQLHVLRWISSCVFSWMKNTCQVGCQAMEPSSARQPKSAEVELKKDNRNTGVKGAFARRFRFFVVFVWFDFEAFKQVEKE